MKGQPLDLSSVARWYSAHQRDLPWRGANPWSVLVSEVMLQQTPVNRVLPIYREWVSRWPTPSALADAPFSDVIVAWGKLGYPLRARRLHEAASRITNEYGGEVPSDLAALKSLPGVGDYTARAVAVFSYGRRHGVVDGNVRRVLARAVGGVADWKPSRAQIVLAESLLPRSCSSSAHLSAGLMELGALVCRRSPACKECPLAPQCRWLASGRPEGIPLRRQPSYQGSDRQARGLLLEVLRGGKPLDTSSARRAVPDAARRRRALDGLVADGLIVRQGRTWRFPEGPSQATIGGQQPLTSPTGLTGFDFGVETGEASRGPRSPR